MRAIPVIVLILTPWMAVAGAQTPAGTPGAEFDAASIRANPPESGFHAAPESITGGPGSTDPGMFRCSKCTLATLISKAFELQNYQFPARASLTDHTFEVVARIPAGATPEAFHIMLQNLLKDRFGLAYHYTEKKLRGYQLVLAKNGSKLKESTDNPRPAVAEDKDTHQFGHGDAGARNGLSVFFGSARFRGDHQTTADVAQLLSDQLALPVNDQTGLAGKYDISLAWTGNVPHSGNHAEGAWSDAGHGDHGGGGGAGSMPREPSGPSLFDAVQAQLGLKLVPAEQTQVRVFAIDHVEPLPTAN